MSTPIISLLVPARHVYTQQGQVLYSGLRQKREQEETMFHLEINDPVERVYTLNKPTTSNNTNESPYDRVFKTIEQNEKFFDQLHNDPFKQSMREIKEMNDWGNSFINDFETMTMKATELQVSKILGNGVTREKKVPNDTHVGLYERNRYLPNSFEDSKSLSNTRSYSEETPSSIEVNAKQHNIKPLAGHYKLQPDDELLLAQFLEKEEAPERKVTREIFIAHNKENIYSPDIFDGSKALMYTYSYSQASTSETSHSETPRSQGSYGETPHSQESSHSEGLLYPYNRLPMGYAYTI